METFENTTSKTQCKRRVNVENVNAENTNAENVFYQVWSTTKVGVDSEKSWQKKTRAPGAIVMLFNTAITSESGNYRGIQSSTLSKEAAVCV